MHRAGTAKELLQGWDGVMGVFRPQNSSDLPIWAVFADHLKRVSASRRRALLRLLS